MRQVRRGRFLIAAAKAIGLTVPAAGAGVRGQNGRMIKRRAFLWMLGGLALGATPIASIARKDTKVARIGFLGSASASASAGLLEALKSGLRDHGYIVNKDILIESRWAEGRYEQLTALATELVRLKVEVLVTYGTPGIRAAKRATTTIPIVMAASADAVAAGLVGSLARPDGNVTGLTIFGPEITAKRLELLQEAFPRARKIGVLFNPDTKGVGSRPMDNASKLFKVELQRIGVRGPDEFASAFSAMVAKRVDAVLVTQEPMLNAYPKEIADLAAKHLLPLIGFNDLADAGGLLGYGVNFSELYRRAAYYVDKLLKGAKPADLPIERPTKFDLAINLKAARTLRLTIPQSLLRRADRVIE